MDDIEELKQILKEKERRRYATHFEWPDKRRKEKGVLERLCESMGKVGEIPYRHISSTREDPPDCTAIDGNGNLVGSEVTELVSEKAIRANQQGNSVYCHWTPAEVVAKVKDILAEKDNKKYKGGPYSEIILVIYTDELTITYETYAPILAKEVFNKPRQIDTVFFLFSYDPNPPLQRHPYLRLNLIQIPNRRALKACSEQSESK